MIRWLFILCFLLFWPIVLALDIVDILSFVYLVGLGDFGGRGGRVSSWLKVSIFRCVFASL